MKKRILSVLLCLSIAVGMLGGCGTKEVDATNDKVESDSFETAEDIQEKDNNEQESDTVADAQKEESEEIKKLIKETVYYPDGRIRSWRSMNMIVREIR